MPRLTYLVRSIVVAGLLGGVSCGGKDTASATLTTCPSQRPTAGTACTGTFTCMYNDACTCRGCCTSDYRCANGSIMFLGSSDGCFQMPCPPDAGNDASGS